MLIQRPDPRLPQSWCREGAVHDHQACGALWNSSDPRDVSEAAQFAVRLDAAYAAAYRWLITACFGAIVAVSLVSILSPIFVAGLALIGLLVGAYGQRKLSKKYQDRDQGAEIT